MSLTYQFKQEMIETEKRETQQRNQAKQEIIDRLDERGIMVAQLLLQSKYDQNKEFCVQTLYRFTRAQILDILSVQKNVSKIEQREIFIRGKKRGGKTLNIDRFARKIYQKELSTKQNQSG